MAVRRQKAPYWVLASTLLLIVVVGVALVVAHANGLIHIGRLPAVAERDAEVSEEPIVPPPEMATGDSTMERTAPEAKPPVTIDDVPPGETDDATVPDSKPPIIDTVPKPVEPPVDPAQKARFIAELASARKALGERNTPAAKQHIEAAVRLAASGEQKELAAGIQALPKYVDGFWEAVREGLKGLEEAGELKVGNTFVSIVEVSKGRLTIRANGQNRRYPLDELPAGLAVAIANRWFDDRPDNKVYVGAFYFVDPRTDVAEAKRLWEEAAGAGVDVKRLLALLPIAKQPPETKGTEDEWTEKLMTEKFFFINLNDTGPAYTTLVIAFCNSSIRLASSRAGSSWPTLSAAAAMPNRMASSISLPEAVAQAMPAARQSPLPIGFTTCSTRGGWKPWTLPACDAHTVSGLCVTMTHWAPRSLSSRIAVCRSSSEARSRPSVAASSSRFGFTQNGWQSSAASSSGPRMSRIARARVVCKSSQ